MMREKNKKLYLRFHMSDGSKMYIQFNIFGRAHLQYVSVKMQILLTSNKLASAPVRLRFVCECVCVCVSGPLVTALTLVSVGGLI